MKKSWKAGLFVSAAVVGTCMIDVPLSIPANHREAPITAIDQKADITDWFAFVSYDNPANVTMILNVDPFLEPGNGPNYHPFDPEILYEMKVDNNFDADEDIKIQFRFSRPEVRLPGVFTGFVGAGTGIVAPPNSPPPVNAGTLIVPPAVTALDGPGSEGFNLRQTYNVIILKKSGATWTRVFDSGARKLFAVPANVGPRTMPHYDDLARQGIYDLGGGIKVFAGTVDDPFYIDLGAAFDTLNFRPGASGVGVPGVLSDAQDADDTRNFAADRVAGFNVNTIAIELPITMLTSDGGLHAANDPLATIGTYATTSRPRTKVQPSVPGGPSALSTNFSQIQRMGNPLINELLIGTGDKDKFSMSEPKNDSQFAPYFLDPVLARVLNAAYGGAVPIPTPPRVDLLPLVTYRPRSAPAARPTRPARSPISCGSIPAFRRRRSRAGSAWGSSRATPGDFRTAGAFRTTSPTSPRARWSACLLALPSTAFRTIASEMV